MIKTSVNIPAKPNTVLILTGVLSGYIKNAPGFVLGSLLSFGKYQKTIESDLPKEFVRRNALIAHLYLRLQKKFGKSRAYEILRAAVLTSGLAVQQSGFRNVEAQRNFKNLVKYQQRVHQEGATKLNKMEILEESETCYRFKVTRCMFYDFFSSLGVPELTRLMCSIDNAIFNSYLPEEIIFHRGGIKQRIVDGASECMFVVEKKS